MQINFVAAKKSRKKANSTCNHSASYSFSQTKTGLLC